MTGENEVYGDKLEPRILWRKLGEKNLGAIKQVSMRFSVADTSESTRNDLEEPSVFGDIK